MTSEETAKSRTEGRRRKHYLCHNALDRRDCYERPKNAGPHLIVRHEQTAVNLEFWRPPFYRAAGGSGIIVNEMNTRSSALGRRTGISTISTSNQ
jgi:hypothetical protein